MQECDAHLNYIGSTRNLFSDALPRMTHLDNIEAYDCDNKIPCAKFCFAIDNETPASKPHFALDLMIIDGMKLNDPYCVLIINKINNHNNLIIK